MSDTLARRTARAATMAAWQRSLAVEQSKGDAARIIAAEDALAAAMADRDARRLEIVAARGIDAAVHMIVAEFRDDAVVSSVHRQECDGRGACRISRGTIGRPVLRVHPDEIERATFAVCAH